MYQYEMLAVKTFPLLFPFIGVKIIINNQMIQKIEEPDGLIMKKIDYHMINEEQRRVCLLWNRTN